MSPADHRPYFPLAPYVDGLLDFAKEARTEATSLLEKAALELGGEVEHVRLDLDHEDGSQILPSAKELGWTGSLMWDKAELRCTLELQGIARRKRDIPLPERVEALVVMNGEPHGLRAVVLQLSEVLGQPTESPSEVKQLPPELRFRLKLGDVKPSD